MYIRKTGYVIGTQNVSAQNTDETKPNADSYKVNKIGRVLTRREELASCFNKSANIASIANQGLDYYQVISNQGACEICEGHNGAIYPVAEAKEIENLPPFHPNCKCTIQGYSLANPNHDPWKAETLLWLDIMYGDGTMEQKAQKVLDFYHWTEFSISFIANILSSTEKIQHIGKRMEEFFRLLGLDETEPSGSPNRNGVFQLPGVHFEGKPYPLSPLEVTLPSEWLNYAHTLGNMLDIDYYLVIAFILHESGGNPMALNTMYSDPMQQASGLMQIIPQWHSAYQSGGQYYNRYSDVIEYAEQNGADINNLFDPLGNITIGIMMLNEQRKLCKDPTDMRELVGRQGEGYNSASTLEILYYRDLLAKLNGLEPWYSDDYYSSRMAG